MAPESLPVEEMPPVTTAPAEEQPAQAAPPPAQPPIKKPFTVPWKPIAIGFVALIALMIAGSLLSRGGTSGGNGTTQTPQGATTYPTPTTVQRLSQIATDSAFLQFREEVASFSAIVTTFTLQDGSLVPPILDTETQIGQ